MDVITWWVLARIYESTIEHQDLPGVRDWIFEFWSWVDATR